MATLTYVYSDSTAVLGPLATYAEPHSYDLCQAHAARLTAPRGWEVVRLAVDDHGPTGPSDDDLLALVEAVREAARPRPETHGRPDGERSRASGGQGAGTHGGADGSGGADRRGGPGAGGRGLGRRGHLRVLGTADDAGS